MKIFIMEITKHFSPASIIDTSIRIHNFIIFILKGLWICWLANWLYGQFPRTYLPAVKKIQDTVLISPPIISQYAAIGALCAEKHFS